MFSATLFANSAWLQFCALLGVAAGLYIFGHGFLLLRRRRPIRKTPPSNLHGAAPGLVEVSGLAIGPGTLTAPITGVPCFYYRTVVWQAKRAGKQLNWQIVAEEKLHVPFFLDDHTAKLLIDPAGAELELHRDFCREFNEPIFSIDSTAPQPVRNFLMRHNLSGSLRTRIEEFCIHPKTLLFVRGTVVLNPGIEVVPPQRELDNPIAAVKQAFSPFAPDLPVPSFAERAHPVPTAADEPYGHHLVDLTAAQSAPDDAAHMTQQAKIAAALQRAGIATPDIRSFASPLTPELRVHQSLPSSAPVDGQAAPSEFDLGPPVALMKGNDNQRFLISWRDRTEVVPGTQWKSAIMLWGGPVLALTSLYLLAAQFGWL